LQLSAAQMPEAQEAMRKVVAYFCGHLSALAFGSDRDSFCDICHSAFSNLLLPLASCHLNLFCGRREARKKQERIKCKKQKLRKIELQTEKGGGGKQIKTTCSLKSLKTRNTDVVLDRENSVSLFCFPCFPLFHPCDAPLLGALNWFRCPQCNHNKNRTHTHNFHYNKTAHKYLNEQ